MRKKTKIKVLIFLLICIGLHFVTYSIDSKKVSEGKNPIFVIRALPTIKDGGSAVYYGFGYQVIRWHKIGTLGKRLFAFEIHRFPFFKSFEAGPDPNLKYVDYFTDN